MAYRGALAVCLVVAGSAFSIVSLASAEEPSEKPTAPKQIDQTPPLVPIPNARVSETGLLVGGQPTAEHLRAIQQAGYRMVVY